jgi:hypothetical protein
MQQRLVSATLLASLAVMAQIDLAAERLVRCRNERCGLFVSSPVPQTAYCSLQCKLAERKRRQYRPEPSTRRRRRRHVR